eukprot:TRINITY_DN15155_c0_g2_i3.p1 TRINITY_DN15155_c0_g2~~TRINITY_DN15155_c0_g2_i3.p1  ORF type:complete len:464 (-),score=112.58 TRINITY_DN15155_c0_g2_i3:196-1587(-)
MGNITGRETSLTEEIEKFDPIIFPEAMEGTERLRKKLNIAKNFKKLPNAEEIDQPIVDLLRAAETGDLALVSNLLSCGKVDVNSPNHKLRTALHCAVSGRQVDVVTELLKIKTINLNAVDANGKTALHLCCYQELPYKKQKHGVTEISGRNNLGIFSMLAVDPRVDLDVKDRDHRTALSIMCQAGTLSPVGILLNRGANPNLTDVKGMMPLHYACQSGDLEIVQSLLHYGSLLEPADRSGLRPVHHAARANHLRILKFLKSRGSNMNPSDIPGIPPPSQITKDLDVCWFLESRYTCETHPLKVDFVTSDHFPVLGDSKIGMSMCPGRNKKNWRRHLEVDLQVLINLRTQLAVSLVTEDELASMNIPHLRRRMREVGIDVIEFPIGDKWIPSTMESLMIVVKQLMDAISAGKCIFVHCNGGKGRTGLSCGGDGVTIFLHVFLLVWWLWQPSWPLESMKTLLWQK